MSRKNRKKKKKEKKQYKEVVKTIPKILGAKFEAKNNDEEFYDKLISEAPKRSEPIRILFHTEATYLCTGFAKYVHNILKRLHQDKSIIVGEIANYGSSRKQDPRAAQIPWEYFNVLPENDVEAQIYGMVNGQVVSEDYRENQFGKWKFDYIVATFKPDIVVSILDNWMATYILKSALRENFLFYWMPTVDGYPQKWQWMADYSKCDGVLSYSYFGKRVLETQSRFDWIINKDPSLKQAIKPINIIDVCQAGEDLGLYRPFNKKEIRAKLGIPHDIKIAGTVMRNQGRKLFTRIMESFAYFKNHYPTEAEKAFLLLHTSIPDVGWDIEEELRRCGISECTIFSYLCMNCGKIAICNYIGSPTTCPMCRAPNAFRTPNTQYGYPEEALSYVHNIMDVYIQGSVAEGDGLPVTASKACGVPVLCSDYSALYEKARNGGALPIANETIYTESETMQWRSLFSRKDLAEKLALVLGNDELRHKMSIDARACAEKYYNWDLIAKKWHAHLLNAPIKDRNKTWNKKLELKEPSKEQIYLNNSLTDLEFIEKLYTDILRRPGADPEGKQYWHQILNSGNSRKSLEKHFRKLVEEENRGIMLASNPNLSQPDPIKKVDEIVKEMFAS